MMRDLVFHTDLDVRYFLSLRCASGKQLTSYLLAVCLDVLCTR